MTDFNNNATVNPFNTGLQGGTNRNKITQDLCGDLVTLDRINQAGRGQTLFSFISRFDTTTADTAVGRGYMTRQTTYGSGKAQLLGQFYYTVPDLLPGSAGAYTSSGTGVATQGGLLFGVQLFQAQAAITIQKINIAGSYGQSSTYVGSPSVGFVVNPTSANVWDVGEVLFPVGTTKGDVFEVLVWIGSTTSNGYCQNMFVREPNATSV